MSSIFILIIHTFVIINLFGAHTCTELYDVNMVNDIRSHFYCNWIIIQTCRKSDYPIVKLFQDIKMFADVYITVFNWEDFVTESEWDVNMRPLVLITCWSCGNCLQEINKLNENDIITNFIWLAMEDNSTNTLEIPINCMFIFIEKNIPDYYILKETYRLPSHTIQNTIAKWNSQSGLDFTIIPFIQRRSNFHGETITTLVEPNNSLNRLFTIYEFYSFCYWDLSRRLNFTIKNTTDPKEPYDVSILLHWTDSKTNDSYTMPFYNSWQVIFFKDIGTSIQLDGYLKPFTKTVWISAIITILLTGVFSYAVAKGLDRITIKENLEVTVNFHIYQSFYVFLQRTGAKGKFTSQNIVILSQWILSVCLISFYSATFISFISVVIPKPPFTTIEDILKQKTHNIVSTKHISAGTLNLEKSTDIRLRTLYKNHFDPEKNLKEDPVQAFCDSNNYIFVSSELHLQRLKHGKQFQYCQISDTFIKITRRYMSWSLNRGKRYQRILHFYINQLDSGGALNNLFFKRQVLKKIPEPSTFRGITLEDTIILFIIFLAGLVISIFILLLEIIYKKKYRTYKMQFIRGEKNNVK